MLPISFRSDGRTGGQIFSEKEILDMLLETYDNKLRPKTNVNGTGKYLCMLGKMKHNTQKTRRAIQYIELPKTFD